MKILIISVFFPPDNTIGGKRPLSWANHFSKDSEVDVLTIKKDAQRPSGTSYHVHEVEPGKAYNKLKSFYRSKIKSAPSNTSSVHKVSFLGKIKKWMISRGLTTSTRMPDAYDLWINGATKKAKSLNTSWDVVISTFGPYANHLVALKLKEAGLVKKWVCDFRDLWTESPYFLGIPPFTLYEKYLERKIIDNCNLVTTISNGLKEELSYKYFYKKIEVIQNGFTPEILKELKNENYFNNNKVNITYLGTVYPGKRDPSPLFKALSISNHKDICVNFFGSKNDYLINLVSKFDLQDQVVFHESVDWKTSLQIQKDSDYLLFLETSDPKVKGVLPGKLFEYIFSKTTILGVGINNKTASGELINKTNSGYVCYKDHDLIAKILSKKDKKQANDGQLETLTRNYQANLLWEKMKSL